MKNTWLCFFRNYYYRRIHIHVKFLFIDFVLVNNHRVPFMALDTLTKIKLTERMHRLGYVSLGIWLISMM